MKNSTPLHSKWIDLTKKKKEEKKEDENFKNKDILFDCLVQKKEKKEELKIRRQRKGEKREDKGEQKVRKEESNEGEKVRMDRKEKVINVWDEIDGARSGR